MKAKPDVSDFQRTPRDVDAFLDGGEPGFTRPTEAKAPASAAAPVGVVKPEPTIQKLFRLRWDVANALKMGAVQESARLGRRVTETEIVERLLKAHYKIDS